MQNPQEVQLAVSTLRAALPAEVMHEEALGLILGSGLSSIGEEALALDPDSCRVPFEQLPHFRPVTVDSHAGAFVWARLPSRAGVEGHCELSRPVLIQQGRCHLYEGASPDQICMGVRVMAEMGVRTLIITNAAGALNPRFDCGDIMCMTDYINHTGVSPLAGPNHNAWGSRFPDMSIAFDRGLQALALQAASEQRVRLERGVYIGVRGPELESPAETRMYRQWGADAVGMSTVLEVIAARHMGMRVLGLACLTNKNLPDCMAPTSWEEILASATQSAATLTRLLKAVVTNL